MSTESEPRVPVVPDLVSGNIEVFVLRILASGLGLGFRVQLQTLLH